MNYRIKTKKNGKTTFIFLDTDSKEKLLEILQEYGTKLKEIESIEKFVATISGGRWRKVKYKKGQSTNKKIIRL